MEEEDVVRRMLADAAGVLGLDPEAARDQRAVRRAYAVMLKRHRPDQDPEGFRRVRDAYEMLTTLGRMQFRSDGDTPPVSVDAPPAVDASPAVSGSAPTEPTVAEPPPAAVDDALAQAIARLTDLSGKANDEATLSGAAWQVWRLARDGQPERGLTALGTVFAQKPHLLGQALGNDGVLLAFEHGRVDLGAAVLQYWTQYDTPRLAAFAKELLAHLGKGNGEFAVLGLRVAEVLSLREPEVAEGLLNRLFLELPPQMRGATVVIEQRIAVGRELVGLPLTTRHFLWEVIDRDPSTPAPVVPASVLSVLEALPAGHPVRAILQQVMPDLTLGFNWGGVAATGKAPMQVYTRRSSYQEAREVDSSGSWKMPIWIAVFLFMVVSVVIRNMAPAPSTPRFEYQPPPPPVNHVRDFPSPLPLTEPGSIGGQQGKRELTPEQREMIRRILEKSGRSPSQQERLRQAMEERMQGLPPKPAPPRTPPPIPLSGPEAVK